MEESALVQQIAELHRRYGPLVLRRCRTLVKDEASAEDAVQEVFVRVLENIDQFRGEARPTSWLYRIATNLCIDELRRQARRATVELTPELQEALAADHPSMEQRMMGRSELRRLFRKTDATTLQILVHSHLDEMGQEEIAQLLGISRKTVWTKLDRVKRRFMGGAP